MHAHFGSPRGEGTLEANLEGALGVDLENSNCDLWESNWEWWVRHSCIECELCRRSSLAEWWKVSLMYFTHKAQGRSGEVGSVQRLGRSRKKKWS